ncbi:MAG: holin [Lachnospiraceae bacterium]|nr:holin [Lachnospiraceae bacterium]
MSKKWWKNAGIRAVKTVAQSLVAIGVGAAVSEVDWLRALSIAAVAGLVSVLTSLASLDVICGDTEYADAYDDIRIAGVRSTEQSVVS